MLEDHSHDGPIQNLNQNRKPAQASYQSVDYYKDDFGDFMSEELENGERQLDPNALVFRNQRKQFLNQFGVTFNLPGFITHQMQMYPKNLEYFLSSERFSFPDVKVMTVKPGINRAALFNAARAAKQTSALSQDTILTSDQKSEMVAGLLNQQNAVFDDKDEFENNIRERECQLTLRRQTAKGLGCEIVDSFRFKADELYMRKFKFSDNGNLLVISTSNDTDILQIYDSSTDIEKLLSVRVANQQYISQIKHIDIKEIHKLVFSANDQYLFMGSNKAVLKFEIKTGNLITKYPIPSIFNLLLSLQTTADGSDGVILCKKSDSKVTTLMKITRMKDNARDNILFTKDSAQGLKCKVSEDFKRVFLNNDEDNIYFENKKQMQLPHFNDINVLKIIEIPYRPSLLQLSDELIQPILMQNMSIQNNVDSTTAFLCICANAYDNYINVMHSHEPDFLVKIDRQVTKNNYRFMDFVHKDGDVKILSCRDGELFVDSFNLDQAYVAQTNKTKVEVKSYYDTPFKSLEFQWPFVGFIFQATNIMLLSMHIPKTIFRFALSTKNETFVNLSITHRLEIFYATVNEAKKMNIYKILGAQTLLQTGTENYNTLAAQKKFSITWYHTPLFTYEFADVKNLPLYQLFVKSSTVKGSTRGKNDCRFFFLHKQSLYTYVEGEKLNLVAENIKHVRQINEDSIYFESLDAMKGKKTIASISLNRVSIIYSTLRLERIYEETRQDAKIQNYSIDYSLNRVYIQIKFRVGQKYEHEIIIVDSLNFSILSRLSMDGVDMYGPFKAGIHFLINGNLYYQNCIARMDPLNSQHKLFTNYEDVIPMQGQQQMLFVSPKISVAHKKILYIKKDRANSALRTGIILPYLDERLIIFSEKTKGSSLWTLAENMIKPNQSVNGSIDDANVPSARAAQIDNSMHQEEHSSEQLIPKVEAPGFFQWFNQGIAQITSRSSYKKQLEPEVNYHDQQRVLHINHAEGKIYIHSIKGMLLCVQPFFTDSRINAGDSVATSQNNQVMVFSTQENLKYTVRTFDFRFGFQQVLWEANVLELIEKDDKLLYLLLGENAQQFVNHKYATKEAPFAKKESNVSIEQVSGNYKPGNVLTENEQLNKPNAGNQKDDTVSVSDIEFYERLSTTILEKYNIKLDVNNDGDIGILLTEKGEKKIRDAYAAVIRKIQNELQIQDKKLRVLIVVKRKTMESQRSHAQRRQIANLNGSLDGPSIQYFSNRKEFSAATFVKSFIITREHLVLWNLQSVFLISHIAPGVLKQINFSIPFKDIKRNSIHEVSMAGTCERDTKVVFKINQSHKQANLVIWDLASNIELDSYDVTYRSKVMFDANEEVFVLEDDHIIMNSSGGVCLAYQFQNSGYLDFIENSNEVVKVDRGIRIDKYNKNYMLVRDQLHLGHSYLGILINEKNALKEYTSRTFDPLAFPYFFNQKTELHHFINDSQMLEQILQNYHERDERLLDHVLLIDSEGRTPLHMAAFNEISKSLNILLKKLSIVRVNNTDNFKDVFDNFLDYGFFEEYLNLNYFQTAQMKSIQSLCISKASGIEDEGTIVVDNNNTFMTQELLDRVINQDASSQPVTVRGFDLFWILNTHEGRLFLHKLCTHQNVNFFTTEFVKTLITFLWGHYKRQIIIWIMLPYLAYFGFFIALVYYNEEFFNRENASDLQKGLCAALLVMIAYFFAHLIRTCVTLGRISLFTLWVWITFISNSLNLTIAIMILREDEPLCIRRIESIASVMMWFRFLYFFRIIDETAPLLRMIWQILYDIRAFIFIFVLIIFAFANGFWILSKNQIELSGEDTSEVPYFTYRLSVIYIFLTAVGEYGVDSYTIGGDDENYLWALFVFTVFFLSIVLLNMLIAIMGQSYEKVSEVAQANMMRERILMIMENFFLQKIGIFAKSKYLIQIQPINQEESDQNQVIIDKIDKAVEEMANIRDEIRLMLIKPNEGGIPANSQQNDQRDKVE